MKNHLSTLKLRQRHQGFTLVETVIAMGIITIMITAFLAAFGPAVQGIRKSISSKEASRLSSTLEYELSILSPTDVTDGYQTSFEKAFEWIEGSGGTTKDEMILLYQYRGDPNVAQNDDGTLQPFSDPKGIPGEDYVLQSVVRRFDNPYVKLELQPAVVEGRVFYVRMAQMVYTDDGLTLGGENGAGGGLGKIVDPNDPYSQALDSAAYPEAAIALQARFYTLKSSIYPYVNGGFKLDDDNNDGNPDATGKPIFVRNIAVRR